MVDPNHPYDPEKHTVDKKDNIRFDYLFSYWMIIWFLVYFFVDMSHRSTISTFVKTRLNPKLGLYIALVENIVSLIFMIYVGVDVVLLLKYIIMMAIMKIGPILLIRRDPITWPADGYMLILIFAIYNIYLWFNDETVWSVYKRTFTAFVNNDHLALPGIRFFHDVFGI